MCCIDYVDMMRKCTLSTGVHPRAVAVATGGVTPMVSRSCHGQVMSVSRLLVMCLKSDVAIFTVHVLKYTYVLCVVYLLT